MKCQNCGQNNANVNYTRIINGTRTELHLCSKCARELNIEVNFNFGFQDLFSDFLQDFVPVRSYALPELMGIASMEDSLMNETLFADPFESRGGLMETVPKDELDMALEKIQRKHKEAKQKEEKKEALKETTEKKTTDKKTQEIEQLKAKLQEYIQAEEYEKAAVVRDLIKEKEGKS